LLVFQEPVLLGNEYGGYRHMLERSCSEFVIAKTDCFSPLCEVDIGGVVRLHTTLNWIANLQYDNVDFALDSKKVADQFRSGIEDNSEFRCIITACKNLFHNRYQNSHVEFNRRQVNGVAHELAKVTPGHAISHIYSNVPSCIWYIVANEKQ